MITKEKDVRKIFSCDSLEPFLKSTIGVFGPSGVREYAPHFYICEINRIRFLTKIVVYIKSTPDIYGFVKLGETAARDRVPGRTKDMPVPKYFSEPDTEIKVLYWMRENIIERGISPCILEIMYHRTCAGIEKLLPKDVECKYQLYSAMSSDPADDLYGMLCAYNGRVKAGLAEDKFTYIVLERCDMTLNEWLERATNSPTTIAVLKSIMFQVIYTLHCINSISPGFRHYDLHTANVMLKIDTQYTYSPATPRYMTFEVPTGKDGEHAHTGASTHASTHASTKWTVPYYGIIAKIIDFEFANMPTEGIVSIVAADDEIAYLRAPTNDIIWLLMWIFVSVQQYNLKLLDSVDQLLSVLDPLKIYSNFHPRLIEEHADDLLSLRDMLGTTLFDEYLVNQPPKNQIIGRYRLQH